MDPPGCWLTGYKQRKLQGPHPKKKIGTEIFPEMVFLQVLEVEMGYYKGLGVQGWGFAGFGFDCCSFQVLGSGVVVCGLSCFCVSCVWIECDPKP